jgi:hypothetical protein
MAAQFPFVVAPAPAVDGQLALLVKLPKAVVVVKVPIWVVALSFSVPGQPLWSKSVFPNVAVAEAVTANPQYRIPNVSVPQPVSVRVFQPVEGVVLEKAEHNREWGAGMLYTPLSA